MRDRVQGVFLYYPAKRNILTGFSIGLGQIPDIRLISNAGYLAKSGYPIKYRISGIWIASISGIRPDIRPNSSFQESVLIFTYSKSIIV